jgi:hypothetical protein
MGILLMPGPIEEFLGEVGRGIGEVDALVLQESLAEIRGHLEESAAGYVELGLDQVEAERLAVAAFGNREMAKEAITKREGVFATRLRDLGLVGLCFGIWIAVQVPLQILNSAPHLVELVMFVAIFTAWAFFVMRAFKLRRILTWQVVAVAALAFIVSSGMLAPFTRVSAVWPSTMLISEFQQERAMNESSWASNWAIEDTEIGIMRAVKSGQGAEILESLRTESGYRIPRAMKGRDGLAPSYGSELSGAIQLWKAEAEKVDLDWRESSLVNARLESLRTFEEASRNRFFLQWWQLLVELWQMPLVVSGVAVFASALGVFTRIVCDLANKLFGKGSKVIRG